MSLRGAASPLIRWWAWLLLVAVPGMLVPGLAVAQSSGSVQDVDAVTGFAYDFIAEASSGTGLDPIEANRVEVVAADGPVLIQWSFGYLSKSSTGGGDRGRRQSVRVNLMATLERDGVQIAEWTIGTDEAQSFRDDQAVTAKVEGVASGLFVDQPTTGRRDYVLKVRNAIRTGRLTPLMTTISMRSLVATPNRAKSEADAP